MTVGEYVAKLQALPQDLTVRIWRGDAAEEGPEPLEDDPVVVEPGFYEIQERFVLAL